VSSFEERCNKIKERGQELISLAERRLSITMPEVVYNFDELKGCVTGRARFNSRTRKATILINAHDMMKSDNAWRETLLDTLPHELAHTVCQAYPQFGRGHDTGWKRIAVLLGATPKSRAVDNEIIYGNGDTYTYTDTRGNTHNVSMHTHKKIQKGDVFSIRKTGAKLNAQCKFVVANQATNAVAADGQVVSTVTAGSKASKARAIMRVCLEQNLSYDETIKQMSEGSGYSIALSKACYKDAQEKHGMGK